MPPQTPEARRDWAEVVLRNWSSFSELRAAWLMERYGPPDLIRHDRLVWYDRGPWRRIEVWDVLPYYVPASGPDNMAETVLYWVPAERVPELKRFRRAVQVSRDGKELTSRGTSEAVNFLALNLADEVIKGEKDPRQAREFYDRTLELWRAGKSSPIMRGLRFRPAPFSPLPRASP